jgi:hypothetical protein
MQDLITAFPEQWRQVIGVLMAPIAWIPRTHDVLMDFFLHSPSVWVAALKYVLLLFPAVLGLAAIWCTQLSLYTVPFRSGRLQFVSALLLAWWDAARAVWLYWMGLVRLVAVFAGAVVVLAGFVVRTVSHAVRHLAMMPFVVTGRMAGRYFQPGVPWIAFVVLMLWCFLEAAVFTHVLFPPITEILTDLAETQLAARFTGPALFALLLFLIMGSFACIETLVETLRTRELKFLGQMLAVEVFVVFFEVMFLYREMVVTFVPWFAERPGMTIVAATGAFVGIRALTWFLFGQYGTAPLLSFIARRPLVPGDGRPAPTVSAAGAAWWEAPLHDFKNEIEWLYAKSDQLLEYLALPVLHVMAAAVNFGMVLVASRPVFQLPFKHLEEIPETRTILTGLHLQPRKSAM